MSAINWHKVREAVRALAGLTADETEAAFNLLASINEARDRAPKPKAPKAKGAFKCVLCEKTLPSAHGLKVHMGRVHKTREMFPKETAGE